MPIIAPEVWSDLDHRFVQDAQGRLKKVDNLNSVMTSISNILNTNPGERVMLSEFGSPLRGIVFESMESEELEFVSQRMKEAIEAWDDRVEVVEIQFSQDPDHSSVNFELLFSIVGYDKTFKYQTNIKGDP